jgi:hypothetical protein
MANKRFGHFLYHRLVVPIIAGALAACGQTSGGGLFQPGQIVGGGQAWSDQVAARMQELGACRR